MVENVTPPEEVSNNDKLMALLSYLIWIVALVVLFSESGKTRTFQRYHAIQSLAVTVALVIIYFVVTCVLFVVTLPLGGFGGICAMPLLILVYVPLIYYGILAYQGKYFTVPVVTDFARNQGWLPQI